MPILVCHKASYYSLLDEELFFHALKQISAVRKVEGVGSDLLITVHARPSHKSLRELLGLFYRYGVDMSQLAQFRTEQNESWFSSPTTYWAKKVFPKNRNEKLA